MRRRAETLKEYDLEGFQVFWKSYGRRDAKQDAIKAWCQVRPTVEQQVLIADALSWQTPQWAREQFKFAPLPASYLRGRRWEDERRTGTDRRQTPAVGRRNVVPHDEDL